MRDLVKADRKYTGRGRKSHVFTDEEEKIISERCSIMFGLERNLIILNSSEFLREPTAERSCRGSF